MRKKLTYTKFQAIKHDLLDLTRKQSDIAKSHGVGQSIVSSVNTAKTWPNFESGIRALKPIRRGRVTAPYIPRQTDLFVPATKPEQAKAAGLNPHTAEDRKEDTLAAALKERAEKWAEIDALETKTVEDNRIKSLYAALDTKADKGDTSGLAVIGFVVLLLLVIIALVK